MRTIRAVESVTLDGVMQAPGRPDEDLRDGFAHGGWAVPYSDEVMGREMASGMGPTELLFGRRTYEDLYSFWPNQTEPNPFTDVLNNAQKYVVSATLAEPLAWVNSTLLEGDAADAVDRLKREPGPDLIIIGSGELVRSLIERDLIDEYTLLIHPLVLGSGHRLFPDDGPVVQLQLETSVPTTTGVLIATYRPATAARSA
jgi:dihydrofolate reductase